MRLPPPKPLLFVHIRLSSPSRAKAETDLSSLVLFNGTISFMATSGTWHWSVCLRVCPGPAHTSPGLLRIGCSGCQRITAVLRGQRGQNRASVGTTTLPCNFPLKWVRNRETCGCHPSLHLGCPKPQCTGSPGLTWGCHQSSVRPFCATPG